MRADLRIHLTKKEITWLEKYLKYLQIDVLNTIAAIEKYYADQPTGGSFNITITKEKVKKLSDDISLLIQIKGGQESFIENIYREIADVTNDIEDINVQALRNGNLANKLQDLKNKHNIDLNTLIEKQSIAFKRVTSMGDEKSKSSSLPTVEEGIWAALYSMALPLAVVAKPIYDIAKHVKAKKSKKSNMESDVTNIPKGGLGDEDQFPSHPLASPEDSTTPETPISSNVAPTPETPISSNVAPISEISTDSNVAPTPKASIRGSNATSTPETPISSSNASPTPETSTGGSISPISETSIKDVAKNLDDLNTRTYTRRGKEYTQEVDEGGRFGKMVAPSKKDEEVAKKSSIDNVKLGLEKFFSMGAFRSKYTVALLDAVKGKDAGGGSIDKKAKDIITTKSGLPSIPGLTSVILPLLGAAAIGTGLGLAAKKAMQHFVGDDIDSATKSLAENAEDQKTNTQKIQDALPHMTTEQKAKMAYAMNPTAGTEGGVAPIPSDSTDGKLTTKEESIATMAITSKDIGTGESKETSGVIAKEEVSNVLASALSDNPEVIPELDEEAPLGKDLLEKVPLDELQIDGQKNIKDGLDKLNSVMNDVSEILKENSKSSSAKLPSGFDANNVRNPLISSLSAGLLTN